MKTIHKTKFHSKKQTLGYGFKADASMLIASYPIFDGALSSGKTLLDLSLVHTDVNINKHFICKICLSYS